MLDHIMFDHIAKNLWFNGFCYPIYYIKQIYKTQVFMFGIFEKKKT